jgi:hypothetical protein
LIGVDEKIKNDGIQYTIVTDNREIIFKSSQPPIIRELPNPENDD